MNKTEEAENLILELIKRFEGLSLVPYFCDANKRTIGYGHVILPSESYTTITKQEAEEILRQDLQKFLKAYQKVVNVSLSANKQASLLSLMFNIGVGAFSKSTLLKLINSKADESLIKQEFLRWKFVGKVENKGLLNRRLKEWEIYIK